MNTKRPAADYDKVLEKILDLLGTTETRTSVKEVSQAIGEGISVVQRVKTIIDHVGSVTTRYGAHPSGQGKASYWTVRDDFRTIKNKMAARGYDWSEASVRKITAELQRASGPRRGTVQRVEPTRLDLTERVALGAAQDGTAMAVSGPDRVSPFFGLRILRRDEAKALVEAARQYRDRIQFVEEQRLAFQKQGLVLNKEAIELKQDERLETIGLILSHVDALEREATNLAEAVKPNQEMRNELMEHRRVRNSNQIQIERLINEKAALQDRHKEEIIQLKNNYNAILQDNHRLQTELGNRRVKQATTDAAEGRPNDEVVVRPSVVGQ